MALMQQKEILILCSSAQDSSCSVAENRAQGCDRNRSAMLWASGLLSALGAWNVSFSTTPHNVEIRRTERSLGCHAPPSPMHFATCFPMDITGLGCAQLQTQIQTQP